MEPTTETNWYFLSLLGAVLLICVPFWRIITYGKENFARISICKYFILPTYYTLIALFCIGFIGMVVNTTIKIVMG